MSHLYRGTDLKPQSGDLQRCLTVRSPPPFSLDSLLNFHQLRSLDSRPPIILFSICQSNQIRSMANHSHLGYFLLQLFVLVVVVLALPQTPDTTCYITPPYENITTTSPYHPSSCIEMIPSTMVPVVQSTPHASCCSENSQLTHYSRVQYERHYPSQTKAPSVNYSHQNSSAMSSWHAPYSSKSRKMSTSHHFVYQSTTSEITSRCPSSMYPSIRASVSTASSPMCTPGIDVNKPGLFELWSYSPGVCDLDNKVVTSTVSPCAS